MALRDPCKVIDLLPAGFSLTPQQTARTGTGMRAAGFVALTISAIAAAAILAI